MLGASDLDETDEPVPDIFGTNETVHVTYVLEMVKLARLRALRYPYIPFRDSRT